jgi:hypothetical protein
MMSLNTVKITLVVLAAILTPAVQAKTIGLLCETAAAAQAGLPVPGGQYGSRDASYSTWSVTVTTDDAGKVVSVQLDDDDKEFDLKGDTIKFRAKLINSLEINLKTGRARTTITGFDTKEQGSCKVVSKTEKGLLE